MSSKQINFTIVPDDPENPADARREYANFCAVSHTPFDLTLTFCDVRPLTPRDIQLAETTETVRVPVVSRIAIPFGVVPGLIAALQEQIRAVQDAQSQAEGAPGPWPKSGPLH
jgi:hypothetical protein